MVLTEPGSVEQDSLIPFNQSMKAIQNRLFEEARRNLLLMERTEVFSQKLAVYMRPSLRMEGASGDWITSDGAVVVGPAELLRARPKVELSGRTILYNSYGNRWNIRSQLLLPGQAPRNLDATITPPAENYTIELRLDPDLLPANGDVRIHITLDKSFVPKELGLSDDTRHLSIMKPGRIVALER